MKSLIKNLERHLAGIDRQHGDIFYLSSSDREYKLLKGILNKVQFKILLYNTELPLDRKADIKTNYDSEDTALYKDIGLYS